MDVMSIRTVIPQANPADISLDELREETCLSYERFSRWYDIMYAAMGRKAEYCRPEAVAAYAGLIREYKPDTVLDCACGTGDPLLGLHPLFSSSICIVGSDGSKGMLEECRRHADYLEIPVELHQAEWSQLSRVFPDTRFQLLLCLGHGFFHLLTRAAMVKALQDMMRVTAPGGRVIFDLKTISAGVGIPGVKEEPEEFVVFATDPSKRLVFLRSTKYYPDERMVSGYVQCKAIHVIHELDGQVGELACSCRFWGTPLATTLAIEIGQEAGLEEVTAVPFPNEGEIAKYAQRYTAISGRKPR